MRHAVFASDPVLGACGGPEPLKADMPTAEEAAPMPTATPPVAAALPGPDRRVAAWISCAVVTHSASLSRIISVLINDDGGNTDLPLLPPDANAAPGVSTYTDGRISFYKSGGGETATIVRSARGPVALQDCSIAVN